VLLVLNDPDQMEPLLDAWENVGVGGVTILHSSGIGRLRQYLLRDDLPLIPSLDDLLVHEEIMHRTFFSVVEDAGVVDQLVTATQQVVGDLSEPETGFLVVLPVAQVYGLNKKSH
jgi:nitrogen regulatory protein PII